MSPLPMFHVLSFIKKQMIFRHKQKKKEPNLEDAFDALSLRVVTIITVQLAVRVANKLQ